MEVVGGNERPYSEIFLARTDWNQGLIKSEMFCHSILVLLLSSAQATVCASKSSTYSIAPTLPKCRLLNGMIAGRHTLYNFRKYSE
jgi:hypothetical protein